MQPITTTTQVPAEAKRPGGHPRDEESRSPRSVSRSVRTHHGRKSEKETRRQSPPSGGNQDSEGARDARAQEGTGARDTRPIRLYVEFREDTGGSVVVLRDHRTGQTLAQFPPETLVDARQDLRGILFEEFA